MIVNPYVGGFAGYSGGFAGAWEDWCDKNYYTEENNAKCKNCPQKILGKCVVPAPYTMAGRAIRGIPQQTDLERLGPPGQPDQSIPGNGGIVPPTSASDDQIIAGVPNVALFAGAALIGGGLFYALAKKGSRR